MPPQRSLLTRNRIKAAVAITAAQQSPEAQPFHLPEEAWRSVERSHRLLAKAQRNGWRLAERRCRVVLTRDIERLQGLLAHWRQPLETPPRAFAGDILLDLIALEEEFVSVAVDLKAGCVTVTTEPILLEGVDLGPFEISLPWGRLEYAGQAYSVTALEPNPAAGDGPNHPHLAGESLCEGEGQQPMKAALASRRLLDFFVLVRQVLTTYNPHSAYRELDEWYGVACRDCGEWTSTEAVCDCERCGWQICDECGCGCESCGRLCCSNCRLSCEACGLTFCERCLAEQDADAAKCDSCLEAAANAESSPESNGQSSGRNPEPPRSDPNRLGQNSPDSTNPQPTNPNPPGGFNATETEAKAATETAQAPPEPLCVGQASLPA